MSTSIAKLHLSFRPKSYFWPVDLETHLRATVRGTKRRAELERYITEGRLEEAPERFIRDRLTLAERSLQSRIHPVLMCSEYLDERLEDEIEIARISIKSATYDVTSVYARRMGGLIRYRVIDEYEGDTLRQPAERTSKRPLTLGQLGRFFLCAWPLLGVINMNFGHGEPKGALTFARGESAFYPQFGSYIERKIEIWVADHRRKHGADRTGEMEVSP